MLLRASFPTLLTPLTRTLSGTCVKDLRPSAMMHSGISTLKQPSSGLCIVGGHRGMGMNLLDANGSMRPTQRENTLRSFQQAALMGAAFVEFDVQVTSDGIAVIWHDDDVVFGTEVSQPTLRPVSALSLQEIKALVAKATPSSSIPTNKPTSTTSTDKEPAQTETTLLRRFYNISSGSGTPEAFYRRWLCADDDVIPTFKEVLQSLPPSVGVNVEVKLTNPAPGEPFLTPQAEIDRLLLPILGDVDECFSSCDSSVTPRPLMFSSFDPDVCAALLSRQSRHPVCFLSGCGLYPHQDDRRTSVLSALQFAFQAGCAGVVVPASVALSHSDLVSQACGLGLQVATYGLENSVVENLEKQMGQGVLAVISDDVEVAVATAGRG